MEHARPIPKPGPSRLLIGTSIIAIGMIGSTFLSRPLPLTSSMISLATMATALSMLAAAAVMGAVTPYPRWAHWASAAVLAGWVLASPWISADPATWRSEVRPNLWFIPWFGLTTATMVPRARGWCATAGRRAGWLMVTASVVLGGALMFAERIGRML
jgi:hypothetical protein